MIESTGNLTSVRVGKLFRRHSVRLPQQVNETENGKREQRNRAEQQRINVALLLNPRLGEQV